MIFQFHSCHRAAVQRCTSNHKKKKKKNLVWRLNNYLGAEKYKLVLKKNAGEGKIWEALKENTFCQ